MMQRRGAPEVEPNDLGERSRAGVARRSLRLGWVAAIGLGGIIVGAFGTYLIVGFRQTYSMVAPRLVEAPSTVTAEKVVLGSRTYLRLRDSSGKSRSWIGYIGVIPRGESDAVIRAFSLNKLWFATQCSWDCDIDISHFAKGEPARVNRVVFVSHDFKTRVQPL